MTELPLPKVCMIVHKDYYIDGRVRSYAEALANSGQSVHILCLRGKSKPPEKHNPLIKVITIPLYHKSEGLAAYLLEYIQALIIFSVRLLGLYLQNRYSVIHIHNMPDFLVFAALIPRILGAKIILDIHDPMPDFFRSKFKKSPKSPIFRLLLLEERISTALAHAVITVNSICRDNLIQRKVPPQKIIVVMNLADPKIFNRAAYQDKRQKPHDNFTLLYPGTIAPRYGLSLPICAMPELLKHIPNIRLIIIGPHSDHSEELIKLSEHLQLTGCVEVKPAVPIEQVPAFMAAADIGIYTALPDPHMDIATPVKVLEYAVMGLPIVAPHMPILKQLANSNCIAFFEPGNLQQFIDAVLNLYNNPSIRTDIVKNMDEVFVKHHTWQSELEKYFDLLNRLMSVGKK